ncbi:3-oxoacyl-[acyl-carrier-protein] synthase II [Actinopolyspora alba]|uniref:3-oxoacyl-[acyl-carrier-protein] synthase II n=1 Tax=Actinopolyspora alba TaxID=673379 RepID=A0A1I1TPW9_9ACTN|nr:beta-ketoacyl-[acyl-carrier-protein] synthase family protein [Actinopolyspora alba]SFD60425.1 3-oxoacyl-[acyl-carrier-protein] synthase II [Actinopolyspora alba]
MTTSTPVPVDRANSTRRVVVTGLGVISSIGSGREAYLAGLREGRCGTGPISLFDTTGFRHGNGCEVTDFDPAEVLRTVHAEEFGRVGRFSAAAARMAATDAGFDEGPTGSGLVAVGTTDGESLDLDELAASVSGHGSSGGAEPNRAGRIRPARLSTAVARELGLSDVEVATMPTVCAAGNYTLGYGLDALRAGDVDFALCGGAESVCRRTFASFYRMGALSPDLCRPFDRDRAGVVFGEGAAVLVLESLESALARGARVLAEVLEYHLNCDAMHPTRPDEDSVTACAAGAVRNAGISPAEVDLVLAHGTGTPINDSLESRAFGRVFGFDGIPPVSAPKSMIGHTMGAAAAHSCTAAILALQHGFLPPTVNHGTTDPECPVDCVPNHSRAADPRTVLVNSLGFGGGNAAMVLRRWEGEKP